MIIRNNRISSFVAVILVIAFSLGIISSCLVQKDVSKGLVYDEALNFWYSEKEEYYSMLVAGEEKRSEELVEFEKYTQTNAYIEEVAKERYGLVKDGEIIFVAE